ncbi:carboxymuconolactone decarboxylase family protein [Pantoea anthophila]|uniref:carboxymuconolactone decarboxylase family protein n=1 Tax=Pantoea anthophila TaxID=470931 RepID=UPI00289A26E4|nr:carboxymuconolactone decarboxylase family protein [Pantoea anthophila]MEB5706625.1 carboxymuconolactone decarboxylase family protein [Pantoea anthophila]MEB6517721.1 carboxymuconolactone decarboxylase family protein [Pantoea anthophila]
MSERIDFHQAAPAGMKALSGVYGYLSQTDLPLTLLELLFLRISQINGCAYCIDMHTKALNKAGIGWDKIVLTSVWHESGTLFSEKEKAALQWAECLTLIAQHGAPQASYTALREHFSDKAIVDLNIAIGLMNTYNRMAISLKKLPASANAS